MIKVVAVVKRNPAMTREEFETYYKERHAPFGRRVMGDNLLRYVRNFPRQDSPFLVGNPPDFDCVTEFHFENEEKLRKALAALAEPQYAEQFRREELEFLDMDKLQISVVEVDEN